MSPQQRAQAASARPFRRSRARTVGTHDYVLENRAQLHAAAAAAARTLHVDCFRAARCAPSQHRSAIVWGKQTPRQNGELENGLVETRLRSTLRVRIAAPLRHQPTRVHATLLARSMRLCVPLVQVQCGWRPQLPAVRRSAGFGRGRARAARAALIRPGSLKGRHEEPRQRLAEACISRVLAELVGVTISRCA